MRIGMPGRMALAALAGLAVLAVATPAAAQTAACAGLTDPAAIVDCVDRIMRGESSRGIFTMEVVTENWSRSMEMQAWSLGTRYALVRILSPRKDAGTATLKAGNEIWNYLPRVDRTIKIPASLMSASWMGSHFTNDDLVKESRLIEDYDISLAYEGERDGVPVWEFNLVPRPEAPVVWGRIEYQIRKSDTMPVWARYYDEDGSLVRTMTFFDFRRLGGRLVPAAMRVVPEDKPDEYTEIRYSDLEFDVDLDEDFFSLRRLRDAR
ncbi:MAG: outer membrane lipoprotein-sorting protein [Candidatus Palauibacterales bacterium]|nr:outer membrane lipoprotein-sorting protein [Candidatus Palauibacterales bacterium]